MPRRTKRAFGSVRELPSGHFQARYTGPDARQHKAPHTFVRRDHAVRWLFAEQDLISGGQWVPPAQRRSKPALPTVAEWVGKVIQQRSRRVHKPLQPTTVDLYRKLVAQRLEGAELASMPLDQVTRAAVQQWWDQLPDTPTMNSHAYKLLASALADAVDDELIASNPARVRGAGKPEPRSRPVTMTLEQTLTYLEAAPEHRRVLLMVMVWAGLRVGEACGLRHCDVDPGGRIVRVEQAVSRVRDGDGWRWRIDRPKTLAAIRQVAIPQQLASALEAHMAASRPRRPDALLFPAGDGISPLSSSVVYEAHKVGAEAVGLSQMRVHDLRHTAATLAGQGGASTAELMHLMGHTTPAMAMHYQAAQAQRDRSRADLLAQRLDDVG